MTQMFSVLKLICRKWLNTYVPFKLHLHCITFTTQKDNACSTPYSTSYDEAMAAFKVQL